MLEGYKRRSEDVISLLTNSELELHWFNAGEPGYGILTDQALEVNEVRHAVAILFVCWLIYSNAVFPG